MGVGRELLNFYRGIAQRQGDNWPRFNYLMNTVHALMDQDYSGDINIVPSFKWYNPTKLLAHLSEKDLIELMEGGEHPAYPQAEQIRLCTRISRTMEDILHRFESGDLRPDPAEYHRPRASRRRPGPTRADREAKREHRVGEDKPAKAATPKKSTTRKKTATKAAPRKKATAKEGETPTRRAA